MKSKIGYRLLSLFTISVVIFVSCSKPTSSATSREQNTKEIISFVFKVINNPSLLTDIHGVINNDSILINVPLGTDLANRNYSVPNLAISDKAFKTFCPDLIVVSITDLNIANPSAPSSDLN